MKTLVVPPVALRDDKSIEMFRVWIAEEALYCSVRVDMYAEQGVERELFAWGMMLAGSLSQPRMPRQRFR